MKNPRIIHAVGIIAVIIGLIRIPTLFFYFPTLIRIADTFAITPFPIPYNHPMVTDPEDLDRGLSFSCEKSGFPESRVKWNHYVRGNLAGPHRRTISYVSYFDLAYAERDPWQQQKFETITRAYFCNNGPLALAAACPPMLDAVLISFNDSQFATTIRESRVTCAH
jgi:hypothetical protein